MRWLCECCSTYNSGGDKYCFVCDKKRSRREVMHARRLAEEPRRLARERRYEEIKDPLYKVLYRSGITLFFAGVITYIIVALISLYLIMKDGMLNDLIIRIITMGGGALFKMLSVFTVNCRMILEGIVNSSSIHSSYNNLLGIWTNISVSVDSILVFLDLLRVENLEKIQNILAIGEGLKENAVASFTMLFSALAVVSINLIEKTRGVFGNLQYAFQVASANLRMLMVNLGYAMEGVWRDIYGILSNAAFIIKSAINRMGSVLVNLRSIIVKVAERVLQFKNIQFN